MSTFKLVFLLNKQILQLFQFIWTLLKYRRPSYHIKVDIVRFLKIIRLLRKLVYILINACSTCPVNGIRIGQLKVSQVIGFCYI